MDVSCAGFDADGSGAFLSSRPVVLTVRCRYPRQGRRCNSQAIERIHKGPEMSDRAAEYRGTALLGYHARPTHFLISIGAALPHVASWALELPAVDKIRLSGAG